MVKVEHQVVVANPAHPVAPHADTIEQVATEVYATVRGRIGKERAVSVRWDAIVKLVAGTRTAREWRPGEELPEQTVAVQCTGLGWTG